MNRLMIREGGEPHFRVNAFPAFRKSVLPALLLCGSLLAGCATPQKPPQISYDRNVPALPALPASVTDDRPKPIHIPPAWKPAKGGAAATTPLGRVENANAAARVQPRREGYYNAIQIYPWSQGALYQVYAAPGQITDIALGPGESLTGAGPIAAGDTARWIIGDTESGSGVTRRVHVLVKPTRPDITTNLFITTDRRTYMLELRSDKKPYMPAVAWAYPRPPASRRHAVPAKPVIPAVAARNYRYGLTGDNPPWKPVSVYDDGRHVYVEFPHGIVQGEMPPIFVIGADGKAQIANNRTYRNILIVDRLFGAAELRLGAGEHQQTVRSRAHGRETIMTDAENNAGSMRLRAEPPRVTRLSRKVLAGIGTVALVGIGGALIYALQTRTASNDGKELYSTANRQPADGLASLPRDYTGPVLGPPLPGDLGRPILDAQNKGQPVVTPTVDEAEQRRLAEEEAARLSRVFFQTRAGSTAGTPGAMITPNLPGVDLASLTAQTGRQTAQEKQLAFLNAAVDRRTTAPDRVTAPASPFVLQAGSVIPAALITGIRSDLPGQVTAQVTEPVYDSPTGRILLLPQGTRIIGQYDNSIQFGQRRVLLVWNRLILPNGRSIVLERQPGADAQGYAGLEDGVDYHWWDLAKAAGLSTLLSVGAELAVDDEERLLRAIRDGGQETINDAGQQIVRRQLQVSPTLTIRPGSGFASSSRAIWYSNPTEVDMAKLKLGAIPDDKPVKVAHELSAALVRDLKLYAEILARETNKPVSDPIKLIGPMLERFMATDREFMKARRSFRSPDAST